MGTSEYNKFNKAIFLILFKFNKYQYFQAWNLWKDGKALELLDTSIFVNSNNNSEIMRCIHVGLLCVQDRPADRPHMSEVILMLNSPDALLPPPKQPGYFINSIGAHMEVPGYVESSSSCTVHDTTITIVEPR